MRRHLPLLGAVGAALALRLASFRQVITAEGIYPGGTDPYYHLRRAWLALQNGFAVPHRDLFCHFPDGVVDPWPPLFDLLLAACAWVAGGGHPTRETLAAVAVLVPPVLGGVSVVLVYALGRRLVGRTAGLAAAWIYAACPAAAYRAQVGTADHHVAEALLATAIYLVLAREVRETAGSTRRAVGLGVLIAAGILTWLGGVIFAAIAFVFLVFRLVRHAGTETARRTARFTLIGFAVGGVALAPFALATEPGRAGALRAYHLTLLQPLVLLAMAAVAAAILAMCGTFARASRPRSRTVLVLGAAAVLLAGAAALTPIGSGLLEGARFARRATPALLLPLESRPLLFPRSTFSLQYVWLLFGPAGLGAALGAYLLLRRRPARVEPTVLLLLLFASHLVLSLFQLRFTHFLAADAALLAGLAVARLLAWGGRAGGTLIAGVLLVLPGAYHWLEHFGPATPPPAVRSVLGALRGSSPPVSPDAPEYGVVAVWDLGHWVNWLAERPCLDSPFLHLTPLEGTAAFFLAESERAAGELADHYRIRFAVSVPIPVSPYGDAVDEERYRYLYPRQFIQVLGRRESDYLEPAPDGLGITPAFARTLQFRLQYLDGVRPPGGRHPAFPGLDPEMFAAPTLRGWRLHVAADDPEFPGEAGRVKIFERVAGARIEGTLVPGAEIAVRAFVRTPMRQAYRFGYADHTTADASGRFAVRVPYWNRARPEEVGVETGYTLIAATLGWQRRVAVSEVDVREGRRVRIR